jgi:HEAT repeat protein
MSPAFRLCLALTAAALLWPVAPASARDGEFDERGGNVFFEQPDRDTAARIDKMIGELATHSVAARHDRRRALEAMGHWAVHPLLEAIEERDAPIRAASVLTLDAIGDPRAIEPLRASVLRETSHPHVAGFAALALGRYRDAGSIDALTAAVRSPKGLRTLRAAVPLALARIGNDAARELLLRRLKEGGGNTEVRSARLLALGFFGDAALEAGGPRPSDGLRHGLKSGRREEARAAVLAYLLATAQRDDTKPFLMSLVERETAAEVLMPALLGLARYEDSDTTEYLARRASRTGDDQVRILAAELLVSRSDPAALPHLLGLMRRQGASSRLRSASLLAVAGIDAPEASSAVVDRINDKSPLVRAAAAAGATRLRGESARAEALRRIEARLKRGEANRATRENLQIARQALAGGRPSLRWVEVGPSRLFRSVSRTLDQRLLWEVNLAAEAVLDLAKIQNLQTDSEILREGDSDDGGNGNGDSGDEGDADAPDTGPTTPEDSVEHAKPGAGPAVGSPRTSAWQELRDLKVELRRRPYFSLADLPARRQASTPRND